MNAAKTEENAVATAEKELKEGKPEIQKFFAVTVVTSIFEVTALGPFRASCIKHAQMEEGQIPLGTDLCRGGMIAICDCLLGYIPDAHGPISSSTSFERKIELVNTLWWKGNSSNIAALFTAEEEALACILYNDLQPCDPRFLESTKRVLDEIGDNHPSFYICHSPGLRLSIFDVPAASS
ncbi:MAG: hypothetical protein WC435_01685 [Candidatus Paceibacterota bacterium]